MRYLLLFIVLITLTGCVTKVERIETTKIIKEKQEVPSFLLKKAVIPPPPDKKVYLKSNEKEKRKLLIIYLKELITVIKQSNDNMDNIIEWKKEDHK